jgi:hypothetical protein
MSLPKETKPCTLCGVWTCGTCGWQRHGATLARPDLQDCPRCGSTEGTIRPTRHGWTRWIMCHDIPYGSRDQAWDEAPS